MNLFSNKYVIGLILTINGVWKYRLIPLGLRERENFEGTEVYNDREDASKAARKHAEELGLELGKLNG